ncbi:MAG: tetratricopeptide repeat protein [Woeseiaceae bacterium]
MMLWIAVAVLCLLATLFVAWPLYRHEQRLSPLIAGCVLFVVGLSVGLYAYRGQSDIPSVSGSDTVPDIEAMVASLAARMEDEPEDIEGWKMLGRSYMSLQEFAAAVTAYERAVALENSEQAQTLVDLGAAILARDNAGIEGRTSALFESALAIEPNNPSALFYGGIAALNRGNTDLAAERWEILLSLNPPENIRGVLEQRIAEWRGEPPPATSSAAEQAGPVVTARIEVSAEIAGQLPEDASVFIIARDPAQPSPPIAVTRRRLTELPIDISLGDSDSMIPGRNLSAFPEFEIVARVSISGQPVAQSGDWFTAAIVKPAENNQLSLSIDQQVP